MWYQDEEEEVAEGDNKKDGDDKRQSAASGMSFDSNARSMMSRRKGPMSMRSYRTAKQSDKASVNSFMKRNAGVLGQIRFAIQGGQAGNPYQVNKAKTQ